MSDFVRKKHNAVFSFRSGMRLKGGSGWRKSEKETAWTIAFPLFSYYV